MQLAPTSSHPLPAAGGLLGIGWLAKDLTGKHQQGIAAEHVLSRAWLERVHHRLGLGLGQQPHKLAGISRRDGPLINATDLDPMGNGRLLQQPAPGWGGGSEYQHGARRIKDSSLQQGQPPAAIGTPRPENGQ
jgi:hypothetical protein